jgi:hypothetical protein
MPGRYSVLRSYRAGAFLDFINNQLSVFGNLRFPTASVHVRVIFVHDLRIFFQSEFIRPEDPPFCTPISCTLTFVLRLPKPSALKYDPRPKYIQTARAAPTHETKRRIKQ